LLKEMSDVELVGVVEPLGATRELIKNSLDVPTFGDFAELDTDVDGVIIATPTVTHFEVTHHFLTASIPVLLEKPIAPSVVEAKMLTALARDRGVVFQVGHVERFNGAFETCRAAVKNPRYIEARRTGPFSGRSTDIGVVLDLMIHDIDLILALVPSDVKSVRATSQTVYGGHEDLAHAEIEFTNGTLAHCTASRCHASPARAMHVVCDQQQWSIDFSGGGVECVTTGKQPTAHAECVEEDQPRTPFQATSRRRYRIPVPTVNALQAEQREFIAAVHGELAPTVDGAEATRAIEIAGRILEDAQQRSDQWQVAATVPHDHRASWRIRRAG
jgi:predicted dehydrogenase